jgi:hypothetical protein
MASPTSTQSSPTYVYKYSSDSDLSQDKLLPESPLHSNNSTEKTPDSPIKRDSVTETSSIFQNLCLPCCDNFDSKIVDHLKNRKENAKEQFENNTSFTQSFLQKTELRCLKSFTPIQAAKDFLNAKINSNDVDKLYAAPSTVELQKIHTELKGDIGTLDDEVVSLHERILQCLDKFPDPESTSSTFPKKDDSEKARSFASKLRDKTASETSGETDGDDFWGELLAFLKDNEKNASSYLSSNSPPLSGRQFQEVSDFSTSCYMAKKTTKLLLETLEKRKMTEEHLGTIKKAWGWISIIPIEQICHSDNEEDPFNVSNYDFAKLPSVVQACFSKENPSSSETDAPSSCTKTLSDNLENLENDPPLRVTEERLKRHLKDAETIASSIKSEKITTETHRKLSSLQNRVKMDMDRQKTDAIACLQNIIYEQSFLIKNVADNDSDALKIKADGLEPPHGGGFTAKGKKNVVKIFHPFLSSNGSDRLEKVTFLVDILEDCDMPDLFPCDTLPSANDDNDDANAKLESAKIKLDWILSHSAFPPTTCHKSGENPSDIRNYNLTCSSWSNIQVNIDDFNKCLKRQDRLLEINEKLSVLHTKCTDIEGNKKITHTKLRKRHIASQNRLKVEASDSSEDEVNSFTDIKSKNRNTSKTGRKKRKKHRLKSSKSNDSDTSLLSMNTTEKSLVKADEKQKPINESISSQKKHLSQSFILPCDHLNPRIENHLKNRKENAKEQFKINTRFTQNFLQKTVLRCLKSFEPIQAAKDFISAKMDPDDVDKLYAAPSTVKLQKIHTELKGDIGTLDDEVVFLHERILQCLDKFSDPESTSSTFPKKDDSEKARSFASKLRDKTASETSGETDDDDFWGELLIFLKDNEKNASSFLSSTPSPSLSGRQFQEVSDFSTSYYMAKKTTKLLLETLEQREIIEERLGTIKKAWGWISEMPIEQICHEEDPFNVSNYDLTKLPSVVQACFPKENPSSSQTDTPSSCTKTLSDNLENLENNSPLSVTEERLNRHLEDVETIAASIKSEKITTETHRKLSSLQNRLKNDMDRQEKDAVAFLQNIVCEQNFLMKDTGNDSDALKIEADGLEPPHGGGFTAKGKKNVVEIFHPFLSSNGSDRLEKVTFLVDILKDCDTPDLFPCDTLSSVNDDDYDANANANAKLESAKTKLDWILSHSAFPPTARHKSGEIPSDTRNYNLTCRSWSNIQVNIDDLKKCLKRQNVLLEISEKLSVLHTKCADIEGNKKITPTNLRKKHLSLKDKSKIKAIDSSDPSSENDPLPPANFSTYKKKKVSKTNSLIDTSNTDSDQSDFSFSLDEKNKLKDSSPSRKIDSDKVKPDPKPRTSSSPEEKTKPKISPRSPSSKKTIEPEIESVDLDETEVVDYRPFFSSSKPTPTVRKVALQKKEPILFPSNNGHFCANRRNNTEPGAHESLKTRVLTKNNDKFSTIVTVDTTVSEKTASSFSFAKSLKKSFPFFDSQSALQKEKHSSENYSMLQSMKYTVSDKKRYLVPTLVHSALSKMPSQVNGVILETNSKSRKNIENPDVNDILKSLSNESSMKKQFLLLDKLCMCTPALEEPKTYLKCLQKWSKKLEVSFRTKELTIDSKDTFFKRKWPPQLKIKATSRDLDTSESFSAKEQLTVTGNSVPDIILIALSIYRMVDSLEGISKKISGFEEALKSLVTTLTYISNRVSRNDANSSVIILAEQVSVAALQRISSNDKIEKNLKNSMKSRKHSDSIKPQKHSSRFSSTTK